MLMPVDKEIHTMLIQELLRAVNIGAILQLDTRPEGRGRTIAVSVARTVDRAVRVHDDPGSLGAIGVGLGEVRIEPVPLRSEEVREVKRDLR